jgi:hypothetical protein
MKVSPPLCRLVCLVSVVLLSAMGGAAQNQPDTVATPGNHASDSAKGSFKIGVNYNSGLNYFGRTDSLNSRGFYPSLEWDLKDGLYLSSNFIFVNNSQEALQYAGTILEGGYKFTGMDKHFAGNLFVSKFLYTNQSALVESAVKEQAGVNLSFLNDIIDLNIGGDAKFSSQVDWGLTAGLDHIIRFDHIFGNAVLVLDPSVYGYAGTQNFTTSYFQKLNILILPIGQQALSRSTHSFDILAWQLSLPVVLAAGKFDFILDPAWILPENVIDNSGNNTGAGKSLFYITTGISYSF